MRIILRGDIFFPTRRGTVEEKILIDIRGKEI